MERGREQGSLSALRRSIRRLAAKRIPSCGPLPGLDAVDSEAELEQCLEDLGLADSAAARRAVERFAL